MIIAIDPGYARVRGAKDPNAGGCACALFSPNHELASQPWFERPSSAHAPHTHLRAVVVEKPQQDSRTASVPPEVIIELSWVGAAVAYRYAGGAGCPVIEQTPSEWKGSEHKPVQHARLWRILTPREHALLGGRETEAAIRTACEKGAANRWGKSGVSYYPRTFTTHNLLDAVAIGATYLGRLHPVVETHRTLAGKDAWHNWRGYRAGRRP